MTLSKSKLIKNLIKYGVIPPSHEKRYMLNKRENIVKLMKESLTPECIKEIYETEYVKNEDEKDYTVLDAETIKKSQLAYRPQISVRQYSKDTDSSHKIIARKRNSTIKEILDTQAKPISDKMVDDLIQKIHEFYS